MSKSGGFRELRDEALRHIEWSRSKGGAYHESSMEFAVEDAQVEAVEELIEAARAVVAESQPNADEMRCPPSMESVGRLGSALERLEKGGV